MACTSEVVLMLLTAHDLAWVVRPREQRWVDFDGREHRTADDRARGGLLEALLRVAHDRRRANHVARELRAAKEARAQQLASRSRNTD